MMETGAFVWLRASFQQTFVVLCMHAIFKISKGLMLIEDKVLVAHYLNVFAVNQPTERNLRCYFKHKERPFELDITAHLQSYEEATGFLSMP